jgi:hypothetical protein
VAWDKGAYHCRVGDRRLKQTFTDPGRAKLYTEATAAKWLKDMLAKLEPPATTTEGGRR